MEQRHASAKSAESSIQQRGLVLGGLGAWWFWDSIGVLTICISNFYPFYKRIPTESKPLGPKPPINHQLINVLQNGCRRKCLLVKNRVDETSAVITVDGSFWLIQFHIHYNRGWCRISGPSKYLNSGYSCSHLKIFHAKICSGLVVS